MEALLKLVNSLFSHLEPISDYLWYFPTNHSWYAGIPVLGQFSFAIILLVGSGVYFTCKTRFIQFSDIRSTLRIMLRKQEGNGISALTSFMLGLAMRAGPGNIVGITGAISIGGPGALFWMWIAAFFGMATAFMESVLSQLFKEKNGETFVGGLPFYGRRIISSRGIGLVLSVAFIFYALFNVPPQTFNVFTAIGTIADTVAGATSDRQSPLYYGIAICLVATCAFIILGGIKRVSAYSNVLVPLKAILFCGISLIIILINFPLIPYFFKAVFVGAFAPDALFGGAIGVALAQGVKRGLMSNEAGQGTITMAAAVSDNRHPCEQGFVQSLGVFFDTMIICTMTGFIVVMARLWAGVDEVEWQALQASKLDLYLSSVQSLVPSGVSQAIKIVMCTCYGLFAFTTLLGMISFAELSANFISRNRIFIISIRVAGSLVFVPLGTLTVLAGLELSSLWALSDLMNIIMVLLNVPILLIGGHWVYKALHHYRETGGAQFLSQDIGLSTECWREQGAVSDGNSAVDQRKTTGTSRPDRESSPVKA